MSIPSTWYYQAPFGPLKLDENEGKIVGISHVTKVENLTDMPPEVIRDLVKELDAYFKGEQPTWSVPIAPEGTKFQQKVWKWMQKIKYGQTKTYGQLAKSVRSPNAFRAVGQASNKNPISIIIPCHRVLASDGSLHGYAGGLDRKEFLLSLEGVL